MTRVNREAQAMGRLGSHPHIVTVFDLGQEEGQPFMVTELMGGGDVEGLVEDSPENRVPMEQTMEIARAVCRGLEFAHSRGIAVLFTPVWIIAQTLLYHDLRVRRDGQGHYNPALLKGELQSQSGL